MVLCQHKSTKNIKTCVEDYFNNFLTLQITFVPPIPNTYSICRKRFWSSLKAKQNYSPYPQLNSITVKLSLLLFIVHGTFHLNCVEIHRLNKGIQLVNIRDSHWLEENSVEDLVLDVFKKHALKLLKHWKISSSELYQEYNCKIFVYVFFNLNIILHICLITKMILFRK